MFVYPYDTSVCSDYITANIIKAIKTANLTEGLTSYIENKTRDPLLNGDLGSKNIRFVTSRNKDVPPFAHPLKVDDYLIIDARSFTRENRTEGLEVTNINEYKFNMIRAILTFHMANHSAKDLLSVGSFPMLVYSRWIAENITKRMGLNPAEQVKVMIISGFFYYGLFRENPEFAEDELSRISQQIAKATYIPIEMCFEVADQLSPMRTVGEFVQQINTVVNSSRLEKFSIGLLYTILMNSWFGANSRDIVSVSLEHPPTWLALIYSALNDRSYRNSNLSKVVLANDKKEAGKNFTFNLINLVS